jgi:hypothetical protein
MPTLVPSRYQLDLTGRDIDNLVQNEEHTPPMKLVRSITPTYGPYFTESLRVYDINTNVLLTKNIDYLSVDVFGLPTAQTGKEICSILLLVNQKITGIRIDYQTLGGPYEKDYSAIRLLIENLTNDNRAVSWPNITNKPDGFNTNMHLHKLGDVIGFEYLVVEIERLKTAILIGDEINHSEILSYIDHRFNQILNQDSLSILAMTQAANANAGSVKALQDIVALDDKVNGLLEITNMTLLTSEMLASNMTTSEAKAKALLDSYNLTFP